MMHESEVAAYLDSLWKKDDRIFKAVAMITSPAVVIEDVERGERITLVIGSLMYEEYVRYTKEWSE